ncbi:hypothetical protein HY947_04400 [Candidatus Gottesmanbacteria bacterium]|nr:hypothetical protein [Candidatus Gottesmanbacteria bacterium]
MQQDISASRNASATPQGTDNKTKSIITIIFLFIAFPIGFILMWFWTRWSIWIKVFVTIITIIPLLSALAIGLLVTINPREQMYKGKCKSQCKENVQFQTCFDSCMNQNSRNPQ